MNSHFTLIYLIGNPLPLFDKVYLFNFRQVGRKFLRSWQMVINPDENFSYKRLLLSAGNNDVDKHVARNCNVVSHSISDINICAISTHFLWENKKQKKRLFLLGKYTFIKIWLLQSINECKISCLFPPFEPCSLQSCLCSFNMN